jgi:hypothetical protein
LTAASTVPILNEVGLACHIAALFPVRSNPFIRLSLACRGRCQIASSWVLEAVTPQCKVANCSAMDLETKDLAIKFGRAVKRAHI